MKALPWWLQAGFIVGLSLGCAVLTKAFHPRSPQLYLTQEPKGEWEVDVEEVRKWEKRFFWIDARSDKAFAEGHIEGALSINMQNFENQLIASFEKLQENRPMVVYCDQQACKASREVAEKLRHSGFPEVFTLRGGWRAWAVEK